MLDDPESYTPIPRRPDSCDGRPPVEQIAGSRHRRSMVIVVPPFELDP